VISPVSVVVPLYEGERYVGEAIESILAQTMPPADVIVVDDGSSDRGAHIAESYAPRVRVLRQANAGAAVARNNGVQAASQPYLSFLDYDDLWTPCKLEVQVAVLEANPHLAGVFGHMVEFVSPDVDSEIARRLAPVTEPQPGTLISCMLVRSAEFRRVGPLAAGSRADFVDWYLRARDMGLAFEILPELVVRRRVHGRNLSLRDEGVKRDYLKHIKESLDRRRADR
jgi:glycosyltransferase involved in cell wall biosynthesis